MVRWLSTILAFALAACSATDAGNASAPAQDRAAEAPALHPVSGLELITVSISSAEGFFEFETELANSPEAQAQGLMFRTQLGDFEGMIFPSATPQMRSFWMKNTPLPLDIIFIAPDNRILNIAQNTTPYSLESVPSDGPSIAVFEIRGGRSAELGIKPGDLVQWELPQ